MRHFPLDLFPLLNLLVIPLWIGIIFVPGKRWVKTGIEVFFFFAAFCYVASLIPAFNGAWRLVMDPTLSRVASVLSTGHGAFLAWTHFLIGDLFIGRWIAKEGANRGFPKALLIPILILTLLFGPAGLLAFLIARVAKEKFNF